MRIVFLGNHTVGVKVLDTLNEVANLSGVVAHPPDPDDGVRYASVYEWSLEHRIPVIRGRAKDAVVHGFIRDRCPELLWVTDYRYLLPAEVLNLAPWGAVNLHPSLLPEYRGRASVNQAIINGETRLGLTAHFIESDLRFVPNRTQRVNPDARLRFQNAE